MSTNQLQDQPELTFDDLDVIWMEDGLPCFYANYENICEIVESFGFNIYYLIANQKREIKSTSNTGGTVTYNNNNKTANVTPPAVIVNNFTLFKVVNNFVGRSVTQAAPALPSDQFIDIEQQCSYTMPPIPHVLIDKLDQFFRLVDAQHGTESIVMLTYDTDKQGSEGWGILVPDQTNTSVHCNYDPDSIAQIKPDNVMIVGSVHSHPGMAAYASGTDHADQADFDGIHITFGWQKSVNNGATQYYIELQMAGQSYKLDPEDVFEDYMVDKAPDPEVVGWTDKVKKFSPPITGGTVTLTPGEAYQTPRLSDTTKTQVSTEVGTNHKSGYKNRDFINYPSHIAQVVFETPQLDVDSLVICEPLENANDRNTLLCPGCFATVTRHSINVNNGCLVCDIPLSEPDTSAEELVWTMVDYCRDRNIPIDCALYFMTPDQTGAQMLLRITPGTMQEFVHGKWDNPTSADSDSLYDNTLCCSSDPRNCYCENQVLPIDSVDFDNFLGSVPLYKISSRCNSCTHYYDVACPKYSEAVVDFIEHKKIRKELDYEQTIDGDECTQYKPYLDDYYEQDVETDRFYS